MAPNCTGKVMLKMVKIIELLISFLLSTVSVTYIPVKARFVIKRQNPELRDEQFVCQIGAYLKTVLIHNSANQTLD